MSLPTLCGTTAVMGSDSLSLRFPVHKTDRDGVCPPYAPGARGLCHHRAPPAPLALQ